MGITESIYVHHVKPLRKYQKQLNVFSLNVEVNYCVPFYHLSYIRLKHFSSTYFCHCNPSENPANKTRFQAIKNNFHKKKRMSKLFKNFITMLQVCYENVSALKKLYNIFESTERSA